MLLEIRSMPERMIILRWQSRLRSRLYTLTLMFRAMQKLERVNYMSWLMESHLLRLTLLFSNDSSLLLIDDRASESSSGLDLQEKQNLVSASSARRHCLVLVNPPSQNTKK